MEEQDKLRNENHHVFGYSDVKPIRWFPVRDPNRPRELPTEIIIVYRCPNCNNLISFERDLLLEKPGLHPCPWCNHQYLFDHDEVRL